MVRKQLSDEQWMDVIQTCRNSGLSDYQWCAENDIAVSTFYKYASKLRLQACKKPKMLPLSEHQEVVQVAINEEPSTIIGHNALHATAGPAISLHINGIRMEIRNHAESVLLINTLQALKNIC